MPGQLPQPLIDGGPRGVADIEHFLKESRFVPGLLFLLRQRGADMEVVRRAVTQAPLVVGAPTPDKLAHSARDVYGNLSGLAPARPAKPTARPGTDPVGNITFRARVLLIDDDFTESDVLFATDFREQRCLSLADLNPGDVLRYHRDDGRIRSYAITSAPMVLGGTTQLLLQYILSPATE